jgi:hypothetical protein
MPTKVTPWATSQSRSASRSTVIVPNVRVSCTRLPPVPGVRTQATTVSLWTSRPQQRSTTVSMTVPLRPRCSTSMNRVAREEPRVDGF